MNCNNCGKSITSGVGYCSEYADEMQRIRAERDAAIRDLEEILRNEPSKNDCQYCKRYIDYLDPRKKQTKPVGCELNKYDHCHAIWRGVQK